MKRITEYVRFYVRLAVIKTYIMYRCLYMCTAVYMYNKVTMSKKSIMHSHSLCPMMDYQPLLVGSLKMSGCSFIKYGLLAATFWNTLVFLQNHQVIHWSKMERTLSNFLAAGTWYSSRAFGKCLWQSQA